MPKLNRNDVEAFLFYRQAKLTDLTRSDFDEFHSSQYDLGKRLHESYHCVVYRSEKPLLDRFLQEHSSSAVYTYCPDSRSDYQQYVLIQKDKRENACEPEVGEVEILPGLETNPHQQMSLFQRFITKN